VTVPRVVANKFVLEIEPAEEGAIKAPSVIGAADMGI